MLIQLKGKVRIGKQVVFIGNGLAFNQLYKVVNSFPEAVSNEIAKIEGPLLGNNKDYFDDNKAQSLTTGEVLDIKTQQGGEALIDKLIENSSTFQMKTQFSQEKYIKKKKNK